MATVSIDGKDYESDDLNEEVQKTLDDVFGSENYDVGQVFDYGQADGNAGYIGSVCIDSKKGSAYTSHPFISTSGGVFMNDYFDLDYVAHELGHRKNTFDIFITRLLLLPCLYMHFTMEHNHGHHKNVSTELDPASAKKGQSLYHFWISSVIGQYKNAWKIQIKMLKMLNA